MFRHAEWHPDGSIAGTRQRPVVAETVRKAAGHVAATIRQRLQPSPFHLADGKTLRPSITSLLRAFNNLDPAPRRQKAITPKFLRAFYRLSGAGSPRTRDTAQAAAAELGIVGFFFAMRSCEYTTTKSPGKTKVLGIGHITFRDIRKRILSQDCVLALIEYVTVTFVDQKNGQKMDSRTQQRTGDRVLCPVLQLHSLVTRILRTLPNTPTTTISTIQLAGKVVRITSALLLQQIRSTCFLCGGFKNFGFHPSEIGTHSMRSGGAMALFLNDHPVHKIMIFGRWSSDAFLVYIRPQVLEWTNQMSKDMIKFDTFLDASDNRRAHTEDPRTRRPFNGPSVLTPNLHLFH
jgi:hypothetical protein